MPEGGRIVRVLYIDDDPGIARLVQRHLQRGGYAVTVALGAEQGLGLARAGRFDAIALDHYMPGRDGLELLPDLAALPDRPPVIFCTGAEEPRIAVAALKQGAADYVVKDVHGGFLELLSASIGQEITRARLEREKEAAEQEVRESRDRLERLAAQQAVLLREVNHRVSNSLQLIVSLIELQARKVRDPAARDMLRQAAERVEAVTLVHRRLYTGDDVQWVEMKSYLAGLVEELARAQGGGPRVVLQAEPVRVETDRAVSLGLIVNELVTNAVKYAYPQGVLSPGVPPKGALSQGAAAQDGVAQSGVAQSASRRGGEVRVSLRAEGEELVLIVEDDGVGYPPEGEGPRGSGLGSMIVASMARSLRAELTRDPAHSGTRFVLRLPR